MTENESAPEFKSLPRSNDDDTEGHIKFSGDDDAAGFKSLPRSNDDEDDTQGHMGEAFGFSGAIKPDPNVVS